MLIHIKPPRRFKSKEMIENYRSILSQEFAVQVGTSGTHLPHEVKVDSTHHKATLFLSLHNQKVIGGAKMTPSTAPNPTFDEYGHFIFKKTTVERSNQVFEISDLVIDWRFIKKTIRTGGLFKLDLQLIELFQGMILHALNQKASFLIMTIDQPYIEILENIDFPIKRLSKGIVKGDQKLIVCLMEASDKTLAALDSSKGRQRS